MNPDGKNIGIDLSRGMLKKARKKMGGIPEDIFQLEIGNAYQLQFDDQSFDILINNFMIDLLPEKDFGTILAEFYRVLKPGGRIIISSFSFGKVKINNIWLWMAKRYPGLLKGCRPISLDPYLERTGFQIVYREEISQNTFPSRIIKGVKPA